MIRLETYESAYKVRYLANLRLCSLRPLFSAYLPVVTAKSCVQSRSAFNVCSFYSLLIASSKQVVVKILRQFCLLKSWLHHSCCLCPSKKRIAVVKSSDMSSLTEDSGHYAYLHNFLIMPKAKGGCHKFM